MKEVKKMRIRNFSGSKELLDSSDIVVKEPEQYKGKWQSLFDNNNKVHLEIGMGKGNFLLGMAKENPDINFIGVEQYDTIVARAVQKFEEAELSNLKVVKVDAKELANIFEKEIDVIYLNFSDPWPKARHEKRRLTSVNFLKIYDELFKNDNVIIQKTDNYPLYTYSLESLIEYGYDVVEKNEDLASSGMQNVPTEYEEKFMKQGIKINYLKAIKNRV